MKISNRAIPASGAYNSAQRFVHPHRPGCDKRSVQSPAADVAILARSFHRSGADIDYEACGMKMLFALGHGSARGTASCATTFAFPSASLFNKRKIDAIGPARNRGAIVRGYCLDAGERRAGADDDRPGPA